MTARTLHDAAAAPAALTAFLRGVERRGALFAELLAGDAATGDELLAQAMRAFRGEAARVPFTGWPARFWQCLLGVPALRQAPAATAWPDAFAFLADIGRGPRAALLLRLVAGLSEADAAAALGIARPTYRLALQRALPHRADGEPDAEAWRALADAAQDATRTLAPERMARIAREREAAVAGERRPAAEPKPVATDTQPVRPRWVWPATGVVIVATLAALATTVPWPHAAGDDGEPRIRAEALPPASAPAATYDDAARVLTHPDFDLLLDAQPESAAADPAFHAWLAAEAAGEAGAAEPLPLQDARVPMEGGDADTPPESEDAP